jgi:hypothetical protein
MPHYRSKPPPFILRYRFDEVITRTCLATAPHGQPGEKPNCGQGGVEISLARMRPIKCSDAITTYRQTRHDRRVAAATTNLDAITKTAGHVGHSLAGLFRCPTSRRRREAERLHMQDKGRLRAQGGGPWQMAEERHPLSTDPTILSLESV